MAALKNWLILLVIIGTVCRFINLDHKLFSHDEVYTILRSSGYSSEVLTQVLFSNLLTTAPEILQYQQIKPNSSIVDTIVSLAKEDPQHPPLYFLVNRWWLELFGSSVLSARLLPALIGAIAIPIMYLLAQELFRNDLASWLAMALLAWSPFDILYAQIARQYSLLTLLVILSSYLLLRSLRWHRGWWGYSLAMAGGLYTHPFFGFTILAHGGYILALRSGLYFRNYLESCAGAVSLFSPWLVVIISNLQRALGTTNWTSSSPDWLYLPKLWLLSFTALFFDLDVGFDNPLTYLLRLPFLILFGWGIYLLWQHQENKPWLFILANFAIPFLILAIPDLITGGRRSSVSRYLISCFPAIQLAVAYLFSYYLQGKFTKFKFGWLVGLVTCFTASIASVTVSSLANTWWTNVPSYFNANTAQILNRSDRAVLIADAGYDGTNLGDIISLAHLLQPTVPIYLAKKPEFNFPPIVTNSPEQFVFRPSPELRSLLSQRSENLVLVDQTGGDLWKIEK
ncbi:MAG: glycosyltransferase family 39 protein [Pseudanabaenaceae cyanobacterium]